MLTTSPTIKHLLPPPKGVRLAQARVHSILPDGGEEFLEVGDLLGGVPK